MADRNIVSWPTKCRVVLIAMVFLLLGSSHPAFCEDSAANNLAAVNSKDISRITSSVKPVGVPAVPSISKIQKQIDDIMHLNETLKTRYQSQAGEIQKISELARIHQRILNDMQQDQIVKNSFHPEDTVEILRQEKLRLIEQQTNDGLNYFESLDEKKSE